MKKLSVSMTGFEKTFSGFFLLLQMLALPALFDYACEALGIVLSDAIAQFILFCIEFLCIVAINHRFLVRSLHIATKSLFRCIIFAALGFFLYYASNILLTKATHAILPGYINANNSKVAALIAQSPLLMGIGVAFFVPIIEETLYRGLIFRELYHKNPWLGYLLSTAIFSLIHVTGYLGVYDPAALLASFLLYLPAGLCLSWAYVQADTIVAPIMIHITVNLIAFFTTR